MNFGLDACGDLEVTGGRLTLVTGLREIQQNWLIRVRTILGEWFIDQTIGVPYFGQPVDGGRAISEKLTTRDRIREIFARETLRVPGVIRVETVRVGEIDIANRSVEVYVRAAVDAPEGSAEFVYRGDDACPEGSESDNIVVDLGGDNVVVDLGGDNVIL